MKMTDDEIDMVACLRDWSADPDGTHFTAVFENGAWECTYSTASTAARGMSPSRGVGSSFVEAFCNLAHADFADEM
jgi:hypothetical protein